MLACILYTLLLLVGFVSSDRESKSKSPRPSERKSKSKSPRPPATTKTIPNGADEGEEPPQENGTGEKAAADPESYEARREARRKAREERMKAASAKSVAVVL